MNELIKSLVQGFKDSFRLFFCLIVTLCSTVAAFANHEGAPSNSKPTNENGGKRHTIIRS